MYNSEKKSYGNNIDDNYCMTDINNIEEISINPKYFHLYKNFLIKENYQKNAFIKEIMPDYADIESQIKKKIVNVRDLYAIDPLFREMQSVNSFAMSLFKKGFREMFFGPKGIVTKKSSELRSYHKSFESKIDLNTKIFAGSLDYYDYLSDYNSFFERLKNSRKKMLKINGNFTITNNMQEKMHAAYLEYEKKREKYKKKKKLLLKKQKNNSINASKHNKNNQEIKTVDIKSNTKTNFYNKTDTKIRNMKNTILFNKMSKSNKMLTTQNLFLIYKKNSENINKLKPLYKMNFTSYKNINNNSLKARKNSIVSENENNDFPEIRESKKHFTNLTTINDTNQNNISTKTVFYPNLLRKIDFKKKNTFTLYQPVDFDDKNDKTKKSLNSSNSLSKSKLNEKINDKLTINKNQIENYISNNNKSNKSIRSSHPSLTGTESLKINNKKIKISELKDIKLSLKNKIESTITPNMKIENSLNNFIEVNKRYENNKKKLLDKKIKLELIQLQKDVQNIGNYTEMAKHVDFSDFKTFSPEDNHKVRKRVKPNSMNLAFSFKSRLQKDVPVKEFIQSLEKVKEKEKEDKYLKNIRKNVKNNFRVIHNLTINLEHIKKKYNY